MIIESSAFENNENIPPKYSCDGENINPPLTVSDVPEEAKSLVLILHDPDAPVNGGWTHWIVWNISPEVSDIKEGSVPLGATEGLASSGEVGYEGPCPPSGTHRYFFRVYALDTTLELSMETNHQELEEAMEGHVIDQTELVGLYSRE